MRMSDKMNRVEYPPGVVEPLDTLAIELRGHGANAAITLHTISDLIEIDREQLRWLVEVGGPEALRKPDEEDARVIGKVVRKALKGEAAVDDGMEEQRAQDRASAESDEFVRRHG